MDGAVIFDLTDSGHRASVHILHCDPAAKAPARRRPASRPRPCRGLLNEDGVRVAGSLWASGMECVSVIAASNTAAAIRPAAPVPAVVSSAGPVLAQIDHIRHLSWAELSTRPRVKIAASSPTPAAAASRTPPPASKSGSTTKARVTPKTSALTSKSKSRAILAAGHGASGQGPVIEVDALRYLGEGKLPNPLRPSWSLLASGQMDAQWVEMDAVVRATDGSHLLLACESGQLTATVRAAPVLAVNSLLDASIRVRGVSLAATDARGQMQGVELLVPSLQFIQTLQPPVDFRFPPCPQNRQPPPDSRPPRTDPSRQSQRRPHLCRQQ